MINKNCRDFKIADDENAVFTSNVRLYKGNPVLVVGSNKVVFLNAGSFAKAECFDNDTHETIADGFLVKIDRNAKVYTFHHDFDGFCFPKDDDDTDTDTIEGLIALGKVQEREERDFYQIRGKLNYFYLSSSIESL